MHVRCHSKCKPEAQQLDRSAVNLGASRPHLAFGLVEAHAVDIKAGSLKLLQQQRSLCRQQPAVMLGTRQQGGDSGHAACGGDLQPDMLSQKFCQTIHSHASSSNLDLVPKAAGLLGAAACRDAQPSGAPLKRRAIVPQPAGQSAYVQQEGWSRMAEKSLTIKGSTRPNKGLTRVGTRVHKDDAALVLEQVLRRSLSGSSKHRVRHASACPWCSSACGTQANGMGGRSC